MSVITLQLQTTTAATAYFDVGLMIQLIIGIESSALAAVAEQPCEAEQPSLQAGCSPDTHSK